jgi:hypothetical protein
MLKLFRKRNQPKLSTPHFEEIGKIFEADQFLDYARLLRHTEDLLTQLTQEDMDVYNQLEEIRGKLLVVAKQNIGKPNCHSMHK